MKLLWVATLATFSRYLGRVPLNAIQTKTDVESTQYMTMTHSDRLLRKSTEAVVSGQTTL